MSPNEEVFELGPEQARELLWLGIDLYLGPITQISKGIPLAEIPEGYNIARSLATLVLVELIHRRGSAQAPKPGMN